MCVASAVSLNIEVPGRRHFEKLSRYKDFDRDIVGPLKYIAEQTARGAPYARIRTSTQFIVGAADETDREIVRYLDGLYTRLRLDRAMNRWIFMDLRFYCLGAYLGDEGPLSLGVFHLFMSQPHWRDRLRFQVYDPATGADRRLPMGECPRTNIDFYAGWNTVFHVGYP